MSPTLQYENEVLGDFVHKYLYEVLDIVFAGEKPPSNMASKDGVIAIIKFYKRALHVMQTSLREIGRTADRYAYRDCENKLRNLLGQIRIFLTLADPETGEYIAEKIWGVDLGDGYTIETFMDEAKAAENLFEI
jgi:hypothetical protein